MTQSSKVVRGAFLALLLVNWLSSAASGSPAKRSGDPHYTAVGFFDMHVCNWPERPPLLMLLFSTPRFTQVSHIEVTYPDGRLLHRFDLRRYKSIQKKGKAEKRVFINEIDLPAAAPNGWYRARIVMKDGSAHHAQDYVVFQQLARATIVAPLPNAQNVSLPVTLTWHGVPGAQYYRVFIRDLWDDGRLVYESGLLTQPEMRVPDGVLARGGLYSWRVHARDVNEHALLGDFNHGSQNEAVQFSVAE